jgi:hypothetical protein
MDMRDGAGPMRSSDHFMLVVHLRAKVLVGFLTDRQRCGRKLFLVAERAENVGSVA